MKFKLNDDARVIIYDRNRFIIQAAAVLFSIMSDEGKKSFITLTPDRLSHFLAAQKLLSNLKKGRERNKEKS